MKKISNALLCRMCSFACDAFWQVCPICATPLVAPQRRRQTYKVHCTKSERSAFLCESLAQGFSASIYAEILLNERIGDFEAGYPIVGKPITKAERSRLSLSLSAQLLDHLHLVARERNVASSRLARAILFAWADGAELAVPALARVGG